MNYLIIRRIFQVFQQLVVLFGKRMALVLFFFFSFFWFLCSFPPQTNVWLDHFFMDLTQKIASKFRAPHPDLLILAVDMETLASVPFRWPWPRKEVAGLFCAIASGSPRLLLVDILFQHQESLTDPAGDNLLKTAIGNLGNVALVSLVEQISTPFGIETTSYFSHETFRREAAINGFLSHPIDSDGSIRSFICQDERMNSDSIVFQIVRKLNQDTPIPGVKAGISRSLITFPQKNGGIPVVRVSDLLLGKVTSAILKEKIVVLGVTARVLHDFHKTPIGIIPGVNVLAASLDTLLQNRTGVVISNHASRLISGLLGGVAGISCMLSVSFPFLFSAVLLGTVLGIVLVFSEILRVHPPLGSLVLAWCYTTFVILCVERFLNLVAIQIMRAESLAAGKIQKQLFAQKDWEFYGYSCRGFCLPCEETGGDYYDFFSQPDGSLIFFIGDVTGHGFSAAMVTIVAKSVSSLLNKLELLTPHNGLLTLNSLLFELLDKKKLMTAFIGHLDPKTNIVSLISAGHLPAVHVDKEGNLQEIGHPSLPLGVREVLHFNSLEVELKPGDHLLIYTDGVVEALDWKDKSFGYYPWLDLLKKVLPSSKKKFPLETLLEEPRKHTRGRPFSDDITLLAVYRELES